MIATILDRAGYDPTVVVGGLLNTIGSNARLGKGEYIVLEADESDGSFLLLSPTMAVVTNIEADHLDHYKDLAEIQESFLLFANKVPFYGATVLCLDDPIVQSLIPRLKRRFITFGTAAQADVSILETTPKGLGSTFKLRYNGGATQTLELRVPGVHNVLNATAAFAATRDMGVEPSVIAAALKEFQGVDRRFQIKCSEGITVVDDYAHHPTEVRATLSAAKAGAFRRIFAVFQPHRYTRTMHLMKDFARAFNLADVVLEFLDGNERFGFQAGIDDHEVVIDANDFGGDDFAGTHVLARQGFFEQCGKTFHAGYLLVGCCGNRHMSYTG